MLRGNSKDIYRPDSGPGLVLKPIVVQQSTTTVSPDNLPLYFSPDLKGKQDLSSDDDITRMINALPVPDADDTVGAMRLEQHTTPKH